MPATMVSGRKPSTCTTLQLKRSCQASSKTLEATFSMVLASVMASLYLRRVIPFRLSYLLSGDHLLLTPILFKAECLLHFPKTRWRPLSTVINNPLFLLIFHQTSTRRSRRCRVWQAFCSSPIKSLRSLPLLTPTIQMPIILILLATILATTMVPSNLVCWATCPLAPPKRPLLIMSLPSSPRATIRVILPLELSRPISPVALSNSKRTCSRQISSRRRRKRMCNRQLVRLQVRCTT